MAHMFSSSSESWDREMPQATRSQYLIGLLDGTHVQLFKRIVYRILIIICKQLLESFCKIKMSMQCFTTTTEISL